MEAATPLGFLTHGTRKSQVIVLWGPSTPLNAMLATQVVFLKPKNKNKNKEQFYA